METISCLTLLFAAVSAIGACYAVQLTIKASRFQSRSTYIKYYASPEMYKSLEILSEIQGKNLPAFQYSRTPENNDSWKPSLSVNSTIPDSLGLTAEEAEKIDFARRTVKFFFLELYKQHKKKCIDDEFFKDCIHQSSIVLLFQIIEILEYAINPEYNPDAFHALMKKVKKKYPELLAKKHHFHDKQLVYSNLLSVAPVSQTHTVFVEPSHQQTYRLAITLTK